MNKILAVRPEKCTGCRICEMVCAIQKEGVVNPLKARIHIIRWEEMAIEMPMVCQQCESPVCMAVCPVNAISREVNLGCVIIDHDACIGCKMCMTACPFGSIGFDPQTKKNLKCDLCNGDPVCVKFCETKAIEFLDASTFNLKRRREAAGKLPDLVHRFAETQ